MNDMLGSVGNTCLPTSWFDYSTNTINYTTSVTSFSPYCLTSQMEEKSTDELQINIKKSPIKFNFNL